MKTFFSALMIIFIFLISGCITDRYTIKDNNRSEVFIPETRDNYSAHLFWYYNRDENGKFIKVNNKKLLFDSKRDTFIFIHGWRGVGNLGWTNHSVMNGPAMIFPPAAMLISFLYNIPDNGAVFPDEKETIKNYNYAVFDWQKYNSIEFDFETSENLPILENNLKTSAIDRPLIPENLAKEIELFVTKTNYEKNIILAAHSLGNQVVLRAYDMLSDNVKEKVKSVILLDPFTTNYYQYLFDKVHANFEWLSGHVNPDIKNDLTTLIEKSGIKEKLYVIVATDVGKSWAENIAYPLNIVTIENKYKELPLDSSYPYKVKKAHNGVVDKFFFDMEYNDIFNF
jgi:pimeloyl-ACP methyl ester carboxylesterase